ncbi:MAG TPA: porin [Longimicrobiales bacterium]|nr:porin [Longimicrobiales bacterium]
MAVAACLFQAVGAPVAAQAPAVRATLTGRSHFQWSTTSVGEDEAGSAQVSSTFETRRVRLAAEVQVSDWIRGRIEPEFTLGTLRLRQAWMSFAFDPAFVVRAGQVKKPFGAINLKSSADGAVIERGVRIRGLESALTRANPDAYASLRGSTLIGEQHALLDGQAYLGYDQGVTVEGERGALSWAAGIYNGSGPDARDENDGKSIAARMDVRMPTSAPLKVGAAFSRRELNWPAASGAETRSGNAFAVDVELGAFRRAGVWLMAEAALGDNLVTEERFTGAQVIASWHRPTGSDRVEAVEPVARVSWGDPDGTMDGDGGVLVTPGVNLYFAGRNRFMLNWDVYVPEGDGVDTQHALRAQFNLHF